MVLICLKKCGGLGNRAAGFWGTLCYVKCDSCINMPAAPMWDDNVQHNSRDLEERDILIQHPFALGFRNPCVFRYQSYVGW